MAVRLYPNTQDVAVLEDLCGVPAGTHNRLQELKSRELPDMGSRYANEQARYDLIHDDPECGCLDAFLTFGWGRANMLPEDAGYAGRSEEHTSELQSH